MHEQLNASAREILETNDMGGFTVPTNGMYPYQWNWDSAFVALGFATFNESRACEELETLFEAQWNDGFVPHIVFRQDDPDYFPGPSVWQAGQQLPTSGISQPPVAASIILALWQRTTDSAIKERLTQLVPKVLDWHRWYQRCRVPAGVNAVVITHPWESGRDNSPEWDAPAAAIDISGVKPYQRRDLQHADANMRPTKDDYDRYLALIDYGRAVNWNHERIAASGPFRVADVGITMMLVRAHRDLAVLADEVGLHDASAELAGYIAQLEAGVGYLWDPSERTFCSRDVITGRYSGYVTSASFLYAYADVGEPSQRDAMAEHWHRIAERSPLMMPSLDPDAEAFDAMRYWRGPIWLVVNYMLAAGFREQGQPTWAERIVADSRKLISEFGFNEAYSPLTGTGTGGKLFSWSAAMWLAWCGREVS
ncbi:MAG: hypothetical protein AAGH76_01435 [Pseudomonadota bacterium]